MESLGPTLDYIVSPTGNKNINFQPEYLKCALDNLVEKEEVSCFLHTRIIAAKAEDGRLCSIICSDDEGVFAVEASCFVDATGDANLAHLCGAKTVWGDEQGYVQAATLPFRLSGVDTSCDMSPAAVEKAIVKAEQERIPYLTKEKGFILKKENSDTVVVLLPSVIPEGLDAEKRTAIERDARRQVLYYVRALRKYMPGMENCELAVIGPAVGYRETRRMAGKDQVVTEDVTKGAKRGDGGVARGGWKPEIRDVNKDGRIMK